MQNRALILLRGFIEGALSAGAWFLMPWSAEAIKSFGRLADLWVVSDKNEEDWRRATRTDRDAHSRKNLWTEAFGRRPQEWFKLMALLVASLLVTNWLVIVFALFS